MPPTASEMPSLAATRQIQRDALRAAIHFHPIQVFPWFRNARRGPFYELFYTLLWNCLLGVTFAVFAMMVATRAPPLELLRVNLVMANCVGFLIHLEFMLGNLVGLERWLQGQDRWLFGLYTTVLAFLGVLGGFTVGALALDLDAFRWFGSRSWVTTVAVSSLIISFVLVAIFFWRERAAVAEAAVEKSKRQAERAEREALAANLRALQAQIEPHFLFNTLANVASLIDPDPAKSKRMLESFIRFLRASLGATRAASTTLGDEAELICAYLEVIQVRMGPRLAFTVEVEPDLAGFALPPMLLQPVVENAVRHGLEPRVEGGEVRISARREAGHVRVEVADTGAGFGVATSGGVGLANLRDRLRLLYGDRATLSIGENSPRGSVVTVRLPA